MDMKDFRATILHLCPAVMSNSVWSGSVIQGDYTMAKHHYNKAYHLEPDNQLLLENREKLARALTGDR